MWGPAMAFWELLKAQKKGGEGEDMEEEKEKAFVSTFKE